MEEAEEDLVKVEDEAAREELLQEGGLDNQDYSLRLKNSLRKNSASIGKG